MNQTKKVILFCLLILQLTGCAVRKYRPVAISPAETASRLEARSLQDPGLRKFLERNLGRQLTPWPPQRWDVNTLTLAALYFSPEMEMARARAEAAESAFVTTGPRPNPSLSGQPCV